MKTIDIVRRAARSLRHAKSRTILTSLAIGVGACTVSLALAAGAGGRAFTDEMTRTSGDARSLSVYAQMDESGGLERYEDADKGTTQGLLSDEDVRKISDMSGIAEVTPMYDVSAEYISRGTDKFVVPLSIKVDETEMKLAAGSLNRNTIPKGAIVVSDEFLKDFGFSSAEQAIGQRLTMHIVKRDAAEKVLEGKDMEFTIAAIDQKSDTTLYYQPAVRISAEDGGDIYHYQRMQGAPDQYIGVSARVADVDDVKAVQASLQEAGYTVYSLEDTKEMLFQMVNIAQWGMAGFGFLAILASIFGIINTQYISVLERTQQIGLMKALGMRSKDIGRLFRYEAAWVGLLGGVMGVVVSLLLTLLNPLITDALGLAKGTTLLIVEPITSAVLIASLVVIAVTAGYFPSRKAARLDPIEALRTE